MSFESGKDSGVKREIGERERERERERDMNGQRGNSCDAIESYKHLNVMSFESGGESSGESVRERGKEKKKERERERKRERERPHIHTRNPHRYSNRQCQYFQSIYHHKQWTLSLVV